MEPVTRLAAANAIGSAKLDERQQDRAIELIAAAGPLELPALIRPIENGDVGTIGRKLIQSLEKSPGLSALAGERLVKLLEKLPEEARSGADALLLAGGDNLPWKARGYSSYDYQTVDALDSWKKGANNAKSAERVAKEIARKMKEPGGPDSYLIFTRSMEPRSAWRKSCSPTSFAHV